MLLKIIRLIFIIIPIFFLVWLVNQEFVLDGEFHVIYDFSRQSPFINPLWPPKKLSEIQKDEKGDYYQSIRYDPVFLAVDLPRPSFYEVALRIKYQKSPETIFRVGLKEVGEAWKFQLKDLQNISQGDNWQEGVVTFDLSRKYLEEISRSKYDKKYRLNFLFSSPYLDTTQKEIGISEVEIRLKRDPITFGNFFSKLKGYLVRKFTG